MRRLIIFCFAALMLSGIVLADDVDITRDLSNFKIGQAFEVILHVNISGNLAAVGIEEYAPVNATIINSSAQNFRIDGNKIEFLLFDMGNPIQNQNLTYTVLLNSPDYNFTESHESALIEEEVVNTPAPAENSGGGSPSSGGGGSSVSDTSVEDSIVNSSLEDEINSSDNPNKKEKVNNSENQSGEKKGKGISKRFFNENLVYAGVIISLGGLFFIKSLKEN